MLDQHRGSTGYKPWPFSNRRAQAVRDSQLLFDAFFGWGQIRF